MPALDTTALDAATLSTIQRAPTISGPYTLFSSTFTVEFLTPPPSLHATVLMRCVYLSSGVSLGKKHPQAPPLHLHFSQSESFIVTRGSLGTTAGWTATDTIWRAGSMAVQEITPWTPHCFWPDESTDGDCEVFLWAHPDGAGDGDGVGAAAMDRAFFENLLRYMSDVSEGRVGLDFVQMFVTQHASATALVVFPTAWWLGPLRWWVPWVLQGAVASMGKLFGYRALMEKYTDSEEWSEYLRAKRA